MQTTVDLTAQLRELIEQLSEDDARDALDYIRFLLDRHLPVPDECCGSRVPD